jgi:hypothetical protein
MYWLRHRRPERFDRATWLKLGVLHTALAQGQANGNQRVTLEIGPDGMPSPVEADEAESPVQVCIPWNGRKPLPADAVANPKRNGNPK